LLTQNTNYGLSLEQTVQDFNIHFRALKAAKHMRNNGLHLED